VPVQNPLDAITDPASDDFVAGAVTPVLDAQGVGSATFDVVAPQGFARVRFYVACSPKSAFTVHAFDSFYAGGCAPRFENTGGFPVSTTTGLDTKVGLDLPDGVDFHVVAIPIEGE
jgi:hypothetical protein